VTVDRSSRREVRNPVLALPAAKLAMVELTPDERGRIRLVFLAIRDDARSRAAECWRKHKAPMAVYWKCVGVYANHIARVLA
jgi:hypothetical protein